MSNENAGPVITAVSSLMIYRARALTDLLTLWVSLDDPGCSVGHVDRMDMMPQASMRVETTRPLYIVSFGP